MASAPRPSRQRDGNRVAKRVRYEHETYEDDYTYESDCEPEFTVILKAPGEKKINVIKEVRAITGLSPKEAKDFVEAGGKSVKERVSEEEAARIRSSSRIRAPRSR